MAPSILSRAVSQSPEAQSALASSSATRSGDGAAAADDPVIACGSTSRRVYAHAPNVPATTTVAKIAIGMAFDVRRVLTNLRGFALADRRELWLSVGR